MSNDVLTAILQSHPFTGGFRPNHIARLTLAAVK
jgi:hypothetical protein